MRAEFLNKWECTFDVWFEKKGGFVDITSKSSVFFFYKKLFLKMGQVLPPGRRT